MLPLTFFKNLLNYKMRKKSIWFLHLTLISGIGMYLFQSLRSILKGTWTFKNIVVSPSSTKSRFAVTSSSFVWPAWPGWNFKEQKSKKAWSLVWPTSTDNTQVFPPKSQAMGTVVVTLSFFDLPCSGAIISFGVI